MTWMKIVTVEMVKVIVKHISLKSELGAEGAKFFVTIKLLNMFFLLLLEPFKQDKQ